MNQPQMRKKKAEFGGVDDLPSQLVVRYMLINNANTYLGYCYLHNVSSMFFWGELNQ